MSTFINVNNNIDTNTITLDFVVAGNLLFFFYLSTAGTSTSPSGTQSDWKSVTSTMFRIQGYWTIATSSGTHSVTMGGTGENQSCILAQYGGSDAVAAYGDATQFIIPPGIIVNCGPLYVKSGAVIAYATFEQALYVSTSGSEIRVSSNARMSLSDNLVISNSGYTETGVLTYTGTTEFSVFFALVSIGRTGANQLMLVGAGP